VVEAPEKKMASFKVVEQDGVVEVVNIVEADVVDATLKVVLRLIQAQQ
jgi:hypothetical protein